MKDILLKLKSGEITVEEADLEIEKRLLSGGQHTIDPGREDRTAVPEVVLAEGKSAEQVVDIALEFVKRTGRAIITRLDKEKSNRLIQSVRSHQHLIIEYDDLSKTAVIRTGDFEQLENRGKVGFITAGTSDIPVIREAEIISREMGCETSSHYDVGVAGLHRIFKPLKSLERWGADALVVAAGREGALPTLVSGLTRIPVIGLPVSVGYGIHPAGETALFSMLQSCSPLAVVNIDAGFVAGSVAAKIALRAKGH